ncbi:MAG TPA: copper-translocating P-type ATPase [Candidatus Nitrosopolaris sp.]|nr:copper-translocating P-type ATPase [Candidatus Nitrosopolaris sp.]
MKKLDDRMVKEKEAERRTFDSTADTTIFCDCCNELPTIQPVKARKEGEENKIEDEEQGHSNNQKNKPLLNDKLLIIIGLALTIPIILLESRLPHSLLTGFITLALATPTQILLGRPFYYRFFQAVKHRKRFTTDTLVVLSTSVAYLYSLFTLLFTNSHVQFFEASSSVLTIFTIGEYLEGRVLKTTTESLKNLIALKPKTAIVMRNGREEVVDSDEIAVGDIVIARPGEKIAADGVTIIGRSSIDESMITGESMPTDKEVGDEVIGGTINKNGYLQFKATSVGTHTVLANIIETVKRARMSKAPIQRIADRAVQYFLPIVLSIAIASSLYWILVGNQSISFAITVFATILVVSCPCALGIATPMIISLGIDRAAREGVFIKGGQYLEKLSSIDTIVFDKTGTLTKGHPEVTNVIPNQGYNDFELLQLASSAEIKSEHPIAKAIVNKAQEQSISTLDVTEFNSISGYGVVASNLGRRIFVGSPSRTSISNRTAIPGKMQSKIIEVESQGKTVVAVLVEDKLAGLIVVADTLRENAKYMLDKIKRMKEKKYNIILMSGDNERTARAIAKELGISNVLAEVLPATKAQKIKELQIQGRKVAMIGDGINDAPALTQADIGIAMGSGTDIAMSAGNIILIKSDLNHVVSALKIGEYSLKKIKQNLAMSFAYNAITISIAAGLLYGFTHSLILTPTLAALGWIVSDSAVFGNSLLVRKFYSKN